MLFGLASVLGAFLLFFLQPLAGKSITPWFGGGASVWVTCMVFFQAILLLGYVYAHVLVRRFGLRSQGLIHAVVFLLACGNCFAMVQAGGAPFLPPRFLASPTSAFPALKILLALALSVGLPLFYLSATSPLVQAWFSGAHPGRRPYRLYALSNIGSFAGLFCFPFLAEPFLSRRAQAWAASLLLLGFGALLVLAWRTALARRDLAVAAAPAAAVNGPSRMDFLRWAALAALGSMLLTSGTNYLGWHVAAIPLIWVLPLALYLITFILAFERDLHLAGSRLALLLLGTAVLAMLALPAQVLALRTTLVLVLACGVIFSGCLLIHGLLASLKPDPSHLTLFFLAVSLGGVLGGFIAAIISPLVFDQLHEFHLSVAGMAVAALFLGGAPGTWKRRAQGLLAVSLLGLAGWQGISTAYFSGQKAYRDFYGTMVVSWLRRDLKVLRSGSTIHGIMAVDNPTLPISYFGPESGMGRAVQVMRHRRTEQGRPGTLRIGIIGLGVGNAASHAGPGDSLVIYEISPKVEALSGPIAPKEFPVLQLIPASKELVMGDGRLNLERELRSNGPRNFDVLLVDAFSGGNIPWHLVTTEAMDLYLRHLAADGIVAFHVSNHFRIDSLVLRIAQAKGLTAAIAAKDWGYSAKYKAMLEPPSVYVLLSREEEAIMNTAVASLAPALNIPRKPARYGAEMAALHRTTAAALQGVPLWTDDRNSLSHLLWLR